METALNITINLDVLKKLDLTLNEYAICEYITRKQADPQSALSGWCIVTKKDIAFNLNLTQRSVFAILKKLLNRGYIERHQKTKFIRTSSIYYSCTSFTQYEESSHIVKQEKESNKEKEYLIYTSPSEKAVVKKPPASRCFNPEGHSGCVENLQFIDQTYEKHLIANGRNFRYQEGIYKNGGTDDHILKIIKKLEKDPFYSDHGWDMKTIFDVYTKGGASVT